MRILEKATFEQVGTFVIALVVLICAFYGLLRTDGTTEARVIYGGLIGSVVTFFFQRSATRDATQHTIDAQNNGIDTIRKTVGRIENSRAPTAEEILDRDMAH